MVLFQSEDPQPAVQTAPRGGEAWFGCNAAEMKASLSQLWVQQVPRQQNDILQGTDAPRSCFTWKAEELVQLEICN